MRVVVDDKIPYLKGILESYGIETIYLPGSIIRPTDVKQADALIVRTRTRCDEALLRGSSVRFIATATIGFDHLDTRYLEKAGITWTNCPGCNAASVAQYVQCALLVLQQEGVLTLKSATVGIVGVGHVGKQVEQSVRKLGCKVLLNDPPRQNAGETGFVSLSEIASNCDVITLHTPLVRDGQWPTEHLIDRQTLRTFSRHPVLINSGRGEVVDNRALLEALHEGIVRQAVIDTWENEPDILRPLLDKVILGTPHIAGYSADGKANATRMSLEAFCRFFHLPVTFHIEPPALPVKPGCTLRQDEMPLWFYDPRRDSMALKAHPDQFEQLRGNYPLRREPF